VNSFSDWQGATTCTAGPGKGASALARWIRDEFEKCYGAGIYNCRTVRGGSTTSTHGEGRAIDAMFPTVSGKGHPDGRRLLKLLAAHGKELGIQAIIYERNIYSAKSPNGRAYTGVHPHWDHLHIELTRASAANLTLATIRKYLEPKPAPKPVPKPVQDLGDKVKDLEQYPTLKWKDRHERLKLVQRFLGIEDDGIFGKVTFSAVNRYKRSHGLPADGVFGIECWKLLRSVVKDA
jgi:hypothetical protein